MSNTNIDLIFGDVAFVCFPDMTQGFNLTDISVEALTATPEDLIHLPEIFQSVKAEHIFVLHDGERRNFIGAAYLQIETNTLAPMETNIHPLRSK